MLRTLRSTRSLPSLRSAATSHVGQPLPARPEEFCQTTIRSMATSTPRTRKTKVLASTETTTPLTEPKKRGRPRKITMTTTVHKRSNSTDSKPTAAAQRRSTKNDDVPTIPQPRAEQEIVSKAKKSATSDKKQNSNVPTAADKFRPQEKSPESTTHEAPISTSNPDDLGTRVQAVSSKAANEATKFAEQAVKAIETGSSTVQSLMKDTLAEAKESHSKQESKDEHGQKEIPSGEKTALLSFLGLTGLWVAFGGRFQKKSVADKK